MPTVPLPGAHRKQSLSPVAFMDRDNGNTHAEVNRLTLHDAPLDPDAIFAELTRSRSFDTVSAVQNGCEVTCRADRLAALSHCSQVREGVFVSETSVAVPRLTLSCSPAPAASHP